MEESHCVEHKDHPAELFLGGNGQGAFDIIGFDDIERVDCYRLNKAGAL